MAGRLGHYRNLYVLDQPVNEWLVAMVSVVALGILLGGVAILLVNRGIGLAARRKGKAHATHAVLGGLSQIRVLSICPGVGLPDGMAILKEIQE